MHRHHYHHIIAVHSGNLEVRCGEELFRLNPGDVFWISKEQWHHTVVSQQSHLRYFTLAFDITPEERDPLSAGQELQTELLQIADCLQSTFGCKVLDGLNFDEIIHEMEHIEKTSPPYRETLLLSSYLRMIVLAAGTLGAAQKAEKLSGQSQHSHIAYEIAQYLHTHYREEIRIEDLAQKYSFSVRHLQRIFREMFDASFTHSLTMIRLNAAKRLLLTTDLSDADIAKQTGFSSARAYVDAFRKQEQRSPAQFKVEKRG